VIDEICAKEFHYQCGRFYLWQNSAGGPQGTPPCDYHQAQHGRPEFADGGMDIKCPKCNGVVVVVEIKGQ